MNMYKLTHGGSYCWLSLGLSLMLIFLCVVLFPLPVFPPFFLFLLYFFSFPLPHISWFFLPSHIKDRSVSSWSAVHRLQPFKLILLCFLVFYFSPVSSSVQLYLYIAFFLLENVVCWIKIFYKNDISVNGNTVCTLL